MIDGKEVSRRDCTLSSGSTAAEVSADYLNRLSVGEHTFAFYYNNYRESVGTFRVFPPDGLRTGDESNAVMYAVFASASVCIALAAAMLLKKTAGKQKQH